MRVALAHDWCEIIHNHCLLGPAKRSRKEATMLMHGFEVKELIVVHYSNWQCGYTALLNCGCMKRISDMDAENAGVTSIDVYSEECTLCWDTEWAAWVGIDACGRQGIHKTMKGQEARSFLMGKAIL